MLTNGTVSIGLVTINKKEKTIRWQMKVSPNGKKHKAAHEWKY